MRKLRNLIFISALGLNVCIAQDVVSIVHGTVKKLDKSAKTLVA